MLNETCYHYKLKLRPYKMRNFSSVEFKVNTLKRESYTCFQHLRTISYMYIPYYE